MTKSYPRDSWGTDYGQISSPFVGGKLRKLRSWSTMRFSQARQVVMVESVIQAILTYAMSSFKIPEALLSEIESMAVTFFEHKDGGTKIHWGCMEKCVQRKTGRRT
ncbi:UNVERIFIED_CONTAM: hypothetical protein Sradi_5777100 [Sesamum radiatum]|uniref:Uncharacterized protein n=1 Tax=Sesamum radiatum TaxID=300843 RepID=A0AAW2KRR6_SESRA